MMRLAQPGAGLFVLTTLLALAAIAAALVGEAVSAHARSEAQRRGSALTVQVLAPRQTGVALAARALRAEAGVVAVSPMDSARAARLLDPRGELDPADLPPLNLIEVQRSPAASNAALASALRAAGVRAELHSADAGAARSAAARATMGGSGAALTLLLAIGLAYAARPSPAAVVAADLGAPRSTVLAAHGRAAAPAGFAAGALAAVLAVWGGAGVLLFADDPVALADMPSRVSAAETALVLLTPLAAAGAATLGARAGAARDYDRAERLA